MTTAVAFVQAAQSLKGLPWRHRGRNSHGVDCIGLIELAGMRSSAWGALLTKEERRYGREPWDDQLRKWCRARWGEPRTVDQAAAGDIALVCWGPNEPRHMGVIGAHPDGGLTLIHAHNLLGVVEQGLTGHVRASVGEVYRPTWGGA